MKLIVLTLYCFFIVLASLADAARFYRCVDRDGNAIITDNPPQDATCESRGVVPLNHAGGLIIFLLVDW